MKVTVEFELPDNARGNVESGHLARVFYGLYQKFDKDIPKDVEPNLGSTLTFQYGAKITQGTDIYLEIQ